MKPSITPTKKLYDSYWAKAWEMWYWEDPVPEESPLKEIVTLFNERHPNPRVPLTQSYSIEELE